MKIPARNLFVTEVRLALAVMAFSFTALAPASAATDTWTGNSGVNWSTANNWNPVATPQAGDSLVFSASGGTLNDDLAAGTAIDGITFGGSAFTLNGVNSLLLSGSAAANTIGILNNSGVGQVVGTIPLGLDWGYFTFSSPLGGSVALNGGLTLNSGAVAYFDLSVTSTSLTLDATTGLINGLEGAGLTYSAGAPTGLATLSGTSISAYAGYTQVAGTGTVGVLTGGAGVNLELMASGAAAGYTANNLSVNSISAIQVGNSGGTFTDTITNNGTLNVGDKGGFYVLDAAAGSKGCLAIGNGGGGAITAGPGTAPSTLIFAVNGTTPNNQMAVNSFIWDRTNGATVYPLTVEIVGTGSMFFAVANPYSGGTYVNQGQLQGNNVAAFGTGPVYVGPGASLYVNPAGTWTNEMYLSPGIGAGASAATASGGALIGGGNQTLSGKIHLLGTPVSTAPGNRVSTTGSSTTLIFSGQITGTGTLDIYMGGHSGNIVLSNVAGNNNWTGGLIIEPKAALSAYVKMGAANQLPSGTGTGDITLISGGGDARFDLNGNSTTINALNAPSDTQIGKHELTSFGTANCTLTMGANNDNGAFYGYSQDSGNGKALSLVKIGLGLQTFAGNGSTAFNHNGNTTISNGTFQLEAAMPNSSNIVVAAAGTLDASLGPNGGLTVGVNQTLSGTGTVIGNTSINGTVAAGLLAVSGATTNVGALTNGGSVTLSGGATNIWYVNNAGGTAGVGWSFLNVISNGALTINNAGITTPIRIKIVSLTNTGAPGNALFNPNINQSWTLVQTASPVAGFTGAEQFAIDTSAFSNLPLGAAQFSIGTNLSGNSLVLYFTNSPVITNVLVSRTNNAGTTAVFTVGAAGATPITYEWIQQGTTVLTPGGFSASGGAVTINTSGHTSSLTIANVQDADAGLITVNVTNSAAGVGTSTASLTIIDPPVSPIINRSGASDPVGGGITYLTATSGGTAPFAYVWSYNGTVISGATSSVLSVDVAPGSVGNYSVVVSNQAGTANSAFVISGPISTVPNQVIYEPFDSYGQMTGPNAPYTWENVTNVYNQLTGEPAYWVHNSGSRVSMVISANLFSFFTDNSGPGYPWPGLAGNSINCMYLAVSPSSTDNDRLQFSTSGFAPGTSVYFSFLLDCDTFSALTSDCIAAFCNSANDGTSFNLKLNLQILTTNAPGGSGTYKLGLYKGSGTTGNQGVDAGTLWSTPFNNNQDIFVVGCYQLNSGLTSNTDDVVSMWFNPPSSSFGTTNVPVATLGPNSFGQPNSAIHGFSIHGVQWPGVRYFSDLRIGTTWASVTPTSAPELFLYNQVLVPGLNVVFASQNAGNPVTGNYQWFFNGSATPLSDSSLGDGAQIIGSATESLTISNATAAELGAYKVTGSNTDPAPADGGATLTGSASALLTTLPPALSISSSLPNVILSWPTNWNVVLVGTTNLSKPITWNPVFNPVTVVGTNNTVSVTASGADQFFQLAP